MYTPQPKGNNNLPNQQWWRGAKQKEPQVAPTDSYRSSYNTHQPQGPCPDRTQRAFQEQDGNLGHTLEAPGNDSTNPDDLKKQKQVSLDGYYVGNQDS